MKKLLSILLLISSISTFVFPVSCFATKTNTVPTLAESTAETKKNNENNIEAKSEEKVVNENVKPLDSEISKENNESTYLNKIFNIVKSTPSKILLGSGIVACLLYHFYPNINSYVQNLNNKQIVNFVFKLLTPTVQDPVKSAIVESSQTESYLPL